MEENSIQLYERYFGYSTINWEIRNYFAGACRKNFKINSPDFTVKGSKVTRWRLALKEEFDKEEKSVVSLCLERLQIDPEKCALDEVRVRYMMKYKILGLEFMIEQCMHVYKQENYAFVSNIKSIRDLENYVRKGKDSTLTLECRMIVYRLNEMERIPSSDAGLKSLSQDLGAMFTLGKFTDIGWALTEYRKISAHRSILCVRNRTLRCEIEWLEEGLDVDATWIYKDDARVFLRFLYSGNIYSILRIPKLEVIDMVDHFDVRELKNYFAEDKLTIHSDFGMEEFSFKWIIAWALSSEKDQFLSPCWRLESLNTTFQLSLHLKEGGKERENVALLGHFVGGPEPKELCMDCYINKKEVKQRFSKSITWSSENGNKLGFEEFITRDDLRNVHLTDQGYLIVHCTLSIPKDTESRSIVSTTKCFMEKKVEKHFENLSNDMAVLFRRGDFHDITIARGEETDKGAGEETDKGAGEETDKGAGKETDKKADKKASKETDKETDKEAGKEEGKETVAQVRHRVHKGVLSCRSYVLHRLITKDKTARHVTLKDIGIDIDENTLRIVLDYIYTGRLKISLRSSEKALYIADISNIKKKKSDEPSADNPAQNEEKEALDFIKPIYLASITISLLSLRRTCTKIMIESIRLENIMEILALCLKTKDYKLKNAAMRFISQNLDAVQSQEGWKGFLRDNARFDKEINAYLGRFHR